MKILSFVFATILMTGSFAIAHEDQSSKKAWDCKNYLVAGNKIDDPSLVSDPQLTNLVKNLYAGSFDISLATGPMQEKFYNKILNDFFAARSGPKAPSLSATDEALLRIWLNEESEWTELNQKLQNSTSLAVEEEHILWSFLSAVEKTEAFPSLSFRALELQSGEFAKLFKSGRDYVEDGFSSASLSPAKLAGRFGKNEGDTVLILKSKTGHYVSGAFRDERLRAKYEIVFKPGTRWKILKLVESHDDRRMPHLVFLEEVSYPRGTATNQN